MENKTKKRGLGRGLSALMGSGESEALQVTKDKPAENAQTDHKRTEGVCWVDIYQVEPDRAQPRQKFDDESLEELTASIKQYGVLQPLIVQEKDGFYQIIAGERRWRAAKNAGVEKVPVIIKEYTSEEVLEISLIENIQREDLSPIEEAKAYKRLMEEYQLRQEEVAEKVGKSRSALANALRLLNLEETVQGWVEVGALSAGHAKVLLGIKEKETQRILAQKVIEEGLSVRQLEKILELEKKKKQQAETIQEPEDAVQALIYNSLGQQMQDILGTKVNIVQGKRKGKIEIEYYSAEDLERIMDMINRIR